MQSAAVAEAAAPERPARGVAGQAATAIRFLARNGATPASVVLRLEPEELGRLQVSISHPKDGPAAVSLTVERPETLLMLVRDQAQLHRVLDQAGLAGEGRQLSFELARAEIPSTAAPAFGGGTGPGMAGGGDQTMDLRGQQAGAAPPGTGGGFDPGFQHGQPDPRERGGRHTPAGPPPGPDAPRSDHPAPALRAAAGRGGIDITA